MKAAPTVHRFGDVVGDEEHGGLVDPARCCLLTHITTVVFRPQSNTPLGVIQHPASVALRLEGRLNKSDEHLDAVFLFEASEASNLVGEILHAVRRALGDAGLDKVLTDALPIITRGRPE